MWFREKLSILPRNSYAILGLIELLRPITIVFTEIKYIVIKSTYFNDMPPSVVNSGVGETD